MKSTDRVVVTLLALGIWALVFVLIFRPDFAGAQRNLRPFIESVVEDCRVTGEVYIYGMPYGEIESGRIHC